jgi:hypothetical protein
MLTAQWKKPLSPRSRKENHPALQPCWMIKELRKKKEANQPEPLNMARTKSKRDASSTYNTTLPVINK